MDLAAAVSAFGSSAKAKLANVSATGQPEDQLRTPLNRLVEDLAEVLSIPRSAVAIVGEASLGDLKIRPDFAVTVRGALVGHIELKAPGKGADPRRFRDRHDKEQWEKLRSLPNLIYSDGNQFSLWHDGELAVPIVRLSGDIQTSARKLQAPPQFLDLFALFLNWEPTAPRNAKELAKTSARLCRLLRDEVTEQLSAGSQALTSLAVDWRKLLFPEATDEKFADGYAQAVTFGLLMARAEGIPLNDGFDKIAQQLGHTSTLIGAALRFLTDDAVSQAVLKTSLQTLIRVLDVVDWQKVSKGDPSAWLYFYEDFLEVYDNELRKKTGSYYTPPEVVGAMVRLVDEELRSPRFQLRDGVASPAVTLADPAVGTGTFLLGILRKIAETVAGDEGPGAVSAAINAALSRLIAFEIQLGPFAVAQLRVLAEVVDLTGATPSVPPRMFVTNTLDDPDDDQSWIPGILAPIAASRRDANKIKRDEPITVVIGNPPYKEKAKGLGGWVEGQASDRHRWTPLKDWMPPVGWGVGVYARHLRNSYVYFWRWATWKVFDHGPGSQTGIVCFITVSGFLNGPGFEKMRDYLRRACDRIWVIDCSPEGHQPEVATRIFQDVMQPVCIVLAARSPQNDTATPATVQWRALPKGRREEKFGALASLTLEPTGWADCPADWRAPFLPAAAGDWSTFPPLQTFFVRNMSGVMSGRTWITAPDRESLERRWTVLTRAKPTEKEDLFLPHLRGGKPGDRHVNKVVPLPLAGFPRRSRPIANDHDPCNPPVAYGFRSFDRQWIIPDNRVINQPNPELWASRSERQVYLTAPWDKSPTSGPALTVTPLIPDVHHYSGRGGRVFPLWQDSEAKVPNVDPGLLAYLTRQYGSAIAADDLFAYVVAVAAHPAFAARFRHELATPGLHIPLTADTATFRQAVDLGRAVVWLHTFGERFADDQQGRPSGPPRLPTDRRPVIPAAGAIPQDPGSMPDSIAYDSAKKRLLVGTGYVENVEPAVWNYNVSGKQVIHHWFSYRKKNRERPIMGDRRPPSPLSFVQPDHWLAEYTTELINVINVLGLLVDLEPQQAKLLDAICPGPLISVEDLRAAGALGGRSRSKRVSRAGNAPTLFD